MGGATSIPVVRDHQGSGDANNPLKPGLIWNDFPMLVHFNILQHLGREGINKMRMVSKGIQELVEQDYGLHVIVPATGTFQLHDTHLSEHLNQPVGIKITSKMIQQIVESMVGKLIRILEINEMPSMYIGNQFPFDRVISHPKRIQEVGLKYVDIRLVVDILTKCPNLVKLKYKTGYPRAFLQQRNIGNALFPVYITEWGTGVAPPIVQFAQIISALPILNNYLLTRLTSLRLLLVHVDSLSDYANLFFILLTVKAPNLRKFVLEQKKNSLLPLRRRAVLYYLFSCLAELLSNSPNIVTFEFNSAKSRYAFIPENESDLENEFVDEELVGDDQDHVLQDLIEKYGSDLSRRVFITSPDRRANAVINTMQSVGRNLHQLANIKVELACPFETDCLLAFIHVIPSLGSLSIARNHIRQNLLVEENPKLEDFLHNPAISPLCQSLEKMSIIRKCYCRFCKLPCLFICKVLRKFVSLKDLTLEIAIAKNNRFPYSYPDSDQFQEGDLSRPVELTEILGPEERENVSVIIQRTKRIEFLPDVKIWTDTKEETFPILESLILKKCSMFARDIAKISSLFPNLSLIHLKIPKMTGHDFFGVTSAEVLKILHMRRLNAIIAIEPIIFPTDWTQKRKHARALNRTGELIYETFKIRI